MAKPKFTKKPGKGEEPVYIRPGTKPNFGVSRVKTWQRPQPGSLEADMLQVCGRQYYHTEQEKEVIEDVVLQTGHPGEPGVVYSYGWIRNCMGWIAGKRSQGKLLGVPQLLSLIKNTDRMQDFYTKKEAEEWQQKKKE